MVTYSKVGPGVAGVQWYNLDWSHIFPESIFVGDGPGAGPFTGGPHRSVGHTTETRGVPGYNGGLSAPHDTYDPKSDIFLCHTPHNIAARSLRNEQGGVETNKRSAHQLEIVCYSDKTAADRYPDALWVGDLTEYHYRRIGSWFQWTTDRYGVVPAVRMPRPKPIYGAGSPSRMSFAQWNAYSAYCGHFEVPENTHWDTGAFDYPRMLAYMAEIPEPPVPPDPPPPDPDPEPEPPEDELMTNMEEFARAMTRTRITELVDTGVIGPESMPREQRIDEWTKLIPKDNEAVHPAWENVWREVRVMNVLRGATGKGF